jgi:flagellar hook-associated protein 3 FlgL
MRVAHKTMWDTTRYQLGNITNELTESSNIVATGKRINSLKDDPVAFTRVLNLKSNLSDLGQINKNLTTAQTWLDAGETALGSVQDMVTESKILAIAMRNDTVSAEDRRISAEQIRGYILEIESLANTRVQGQYIFSGTKTDTASFQLDDQQNPTTATYSGNSTTFEVKTGNSTTIEVSQNGDSLFSDLFSSMIELLNALENDDGAGIETGIADLDTDFETINTAIADIGAKGVRVETKEKIIQDLNLSYTESRSKLEDADIIEAVSHLKSTELAYQAALAATSKLMTMSLVDFL